MLTQLELDALTQNATAFQSWDSLVNSIVENDYVPTLSSKNKDQTKLAMALMSHGFKVWDPISRENW